MIEKLEPIKAFNCSDTPQAKMQHHSYHNDCINKINELVDAVNELQATISKMEKVETVAENVRPPYMQNKRLRKALSIAQSALVKLANDAYDMDEHIYIDKILNQIERIAKGGNNE